MTVHLCTLHPQSSFSCVVSPRCSAALSTQRRSGRSPPTGHHVHLPSHFIVIQSTLHSTPVLFYKYAASNYIPNQPRLFIAVLRPLSHDPPQKSYAGCQPITVLGVHASAFLQQSLVYDPFDKPSAGVCVHGFSWRSPPRPSPAVPRPPLHNYCYKSSTGASIQYCSWRAHPRPSPAVPWPPLHDPAHKPGAGASIHDHFGR